MSSQGIRMLSESTAVNFNLNERVKLLHPPRDNIRQDTRHYTSSCEPEGPIGELIVGRQCDCVFMS